MKSAQLISIGFGNIVQASRVIAVVGPDSAPIKRIISDARIKRAGHDQQFHHYSFFSQSATGFIKQHRAMADAIPDQC